MRNIAFADIKMIPIKDGVDNCKENVKVFQQIRCIRIWIWTIWCSIESLDLSVEKIKGFRKREVHFPTKKPKKFEKIQDGNP